MRHSSCVGGLQPQHLSQRKTEPFTRVLRELLQVNTAPLEWQFPETSETAIHLIYSLENIEFTLQMKHQVELKEGGLELVSSGEGWEHTESGSPKMGPTVPPGEIQVSRNTRLGSYNM